MPALYLHICRIFCYSAYEVRVGEHTPSPTCAHIPRQMKNKQFYFYPTQRPKIRCVLAPFGDHKMEISISGKWAFFCLVFDAACDVGVCVMCVFGTYASTQFIEHSQVLGYYILIFSMISKRRQMVNQIEFVRRAPMAKWTTAVIKFSYFSRAHKLYKWYSISKIGLRAIELIVPVSPCRLLLRKWSKRDF